MDRNGNSGCTKECTKVKPTVVLSKEKDDERRAKLKEAMMKAQKEKEATNEAK